MYLSLLIKMRNVLFCIHSVTKDSVLHLYLVKIMLTTVHQPGTQQGGRPLLSPWTWPSAEGWPSHSHPLSPQTGHCNQALGCSGGVGLWPQRTNGPSYRCCCCAPWGHCIPTADPWFHSQAPKSAPCQAFLWVQPTGSRHQCTLYYFFLHTKVSSLRCTWS